MIEERRGPPHGVLFAVVVSLVVVVPALMGDQGEALTGAISEMFTPVGLLFVPIILLLLIQFLSSDRGTVLSNVFSTATGQPDSIHRLSGSPVGVALFLLLLLFLLYNRISLFGSGDDDSE
uniref:Uncharacterized protein n=1 Tax=Nelumbo nucifera TaxID=4432 RepID=A0A822YNY7_NELNU|nr:TPA_asm: hypothetical protein HUJ06_012132 [Nelumbo nucifera]